MEKKGDMLKELEAIKKLLILQLNHDGVSSDVIAKTLGMSKATLYTFLPKTQKKSSIKSI
ncbi:MAG: hypothetical protein GKS07_02270 [Nitrosopumilus sp.]|nr:MAG: hypothetical protein GKS07_02270 [Nitrosopumilus sp.]